MEKAKFGKEKIASYFLERQCPYTKRRPIKMKSLYRLGGGLVAMFILGVLYFGDDIEKREATSHVPDYSTQTTSGIQQIPDVSADSKSKTTSQQGFAGSGLGGIGYGLQSGGGSTGGGGFARNHSANQVIRRGEGGNDPSARLPMGHGVPARLLNAVLSTDSSTPVIAQVIEDVSVHGTVSIPMRTRAIGNASFDDASRRIQVRFHTLVYPEGDQHGLQGIALMLDGSAGLSGDYHSGTAKRQIGKFIGNFVGAFAEGMKERTAQGQLGAPYEPGSIKNGILNGIAVSGQDQAKTFSGEMSQTKPFMTLEAGQPFVIFLEREYMP